MTSKMNKKINKVDDDSDVSMSEKPTTKKQIKPRAKKEEPVSKKVVESDNSEPETKTIKKPIKTIKKKIVEESSEDDQHASDKSDSDVSDDDNSSDSETEKIVKSKSKKKSFEDISGELENINKSIKTITDEIAIINKTLTTKEKELNNLEKQRNKLFLLCPKAMDDKMKMVQKEKPKRQGNKEGGFNKVLPVPPRLIKFLELEKDVQLPRPKIVSLLNEKFKEEGIKQGQITKLNDSVAKALGKDSGREIAFNEFQTFVKEFYEEAFPELYKTGSKKKTVSLEDD